MLCEGLPRARDGPGQARMPPCSGCRRYSHVLKWIDLEAARPGEQGASSHDGLEGTETSRVSQKQTQIAYLPGTDRME